MKVRESGTFDNYFFAKSGHRNLLNINNLLIMSIFWLILRRMADGICGAFVGFLARVDNPASRSDAAVEMNEGRGMQKRFFAAFHPFVIVLQSSP
jgi:hypothetical protein